jgi:malate/lactate dehydrogenase
VGRQGVIDTLPLQLSDEETEALHDSAQIIRDLLDGQEGEGM